MSRGNTLPQDSDVRKEMPLATGVFDYFPAALAEVAKLSKQGNDKHNPGEPLHWARGKSMDHADCIARHLIDRGSFDPKDGTRHSAALAWRALALLQEELEAEGAPLPRGAKVVEPVAPGIACDSCGSRHAFGVRGLATEEHLDWACGTRECSGHLVRA